MMQTVEVYQGPGSPGVKRWREFGKTAATHFLVKSTWLSLPEWSIDPRELSEQDHPLGLGLAARLPQNLMQ
jgi:hypothetical protein